MAEEGTPPEPALQAGAGAARERGMDPEQWLSRVMSRQQSHMTPEIRAAIARRAAVSARCAKSSRRAERLQMCSAMTQQSWARGMRAQSAMVPMAAAVRSAAAESAQSEMQLLQRAMSVEDEDEAEAQFGGELMALAQVSATEAADMSEIEQLLEQLRVEPAEDAERIAKFGLYEGLMSTVEAARKTTFEFYDGCKADFAEAGGASVQATIEQSLKRIDGGDNMAVDFRDDRWFVYDMTRKLDSNNGMLGRVLQDIKTKLDLIAQQDDCPICLDSMQGLAPADIKVLGCCHKVCAECWTQWEAIKHGHAFCPLCKHEEFLTDVCEGHALPREMFERVQATIAAAPAPAPAAEPDRMIFSSSAQREVPATFYARRGDYSHYLYRVNGQQRIKRIREAQPAAAGGAAAPQTAWPELVGQSGADAVAAITASRPDLAQVVTMEVTMEEGGMMTMDFREDRVRVMIDGAGVVTQPPHVG